LPHHLIHHTVLGPLGHQVLVSLAACLPLLVFSGLLRVDPRIGLSPVRRLVEWISLIRQPGDATEREDWRESDAQPRSENYAAFSLSAIELAVVAELNLEIARAHDELADDASQRVETRRAARAKATAIRERAELLHLEARLLSTQPMLYAPSRLEPASFGTWPERRTYERRTRSRRRDEESAAGAPGGRERRTLPDRRQRERRAAES
jgi:hypothetical protein